MKHPAKLRPRSRLDLLEAFNFLCENGSVETGLRFRAAVIDILDRLFQNPSMGAPYESGIPSLLKVRRLPIRGFEKYLLFYQPVKEGIEVVRVLHGSRDILRIFREEER
jgi:toxin ParE1/3/4